jgi:hypothetical protein
MQSATDLLQITNVDLDAKIASDLLLNLKSGKKE